jgi:hypothetical protein
MLRWSKIVKLANVSIQAHSLKQVDSMKTILNRKMELPGDRLKHKIYKIGYGAPRTRETLTAKSQVQSFSVRASWLK